jgi:sec-independent protein translocase protein TatC
LGGGANFAAGENRVESPPMAKNQEEAIPVHEEEAQARMSFGEHLDELRKRVIRAMAGSIFGIAFSFYFINEIVAIITHPYRVVMIRYQIPLVFSQSSPAEALMLYLSLSIQVGLILTSPWIIHQAWSFVAAGLYLKERRIVYRYVGPSALLFFVGVAFFYFIVLPISLNFFVKFSQGTSLGPAGSTVFEDVLLPSREGGVDLNKVPLGTDLDRATIPRLPWVRSNPEPPEDMSAFLVYNVPEGAIKIISRTGNLNLMVTKEGSLFANYPRLGEYLRFVMFTALVFGVAFQLPMIILVLAQVDIVRPPTFRKYRRHAYFALAVISAIASPTTDLMTMFLLMVPMLLLYELGIIAASIVTRGRDDGDTAE